MKRSLNIIVAVDQKNGIGKDGVLPWNISGDMKHFKDITMRVSEDGKMNAVIMGRKTWDSIPERFRPLKERINVVLTRNKDLHFEESVIIASGLDDALKTIEDHCSDKIEKVFVIGGQQLFNEALKDPLCESLFVTHIDNVFDCDAFFPDFNRAFTLKSKSGSIIEAGYTYYFCEYKRSFLER
ncbi:MAG: dihydrofolate reductase [Candidatus Omnitrophica bacterium]|nr:dihydrofolate reductase [Candidatus Omnitrophota bacterium]MBU1995899.1 dihydrofolate reductase [Candidatus Omnitrophota bacterium]MBU4333761.1 dihydrofolate reductase [Candidatus Omnitrophota bacterium]